MTDPLTTTTPINNTPTPLEIAKRWRCQYHGPPDPFATVVRGFYFSSQTWNQLRIAPVVIVQQGFTGMRLVIVHSTEACAAFKPSNIVESIVCSMDWGFDDKRIVDTAKADTAADLYARLESLGGCKL